MLRSLLLLHCFVDGDVLQAYFSTVRQVVQRRPKLFFFTCVGCYSFMQLLVCLLFMRLQLETVLLVHSFTVAILGLAISAGFVYFRFEVLDDTSLPRSLPRPLPRSLAHHAIPVLDAGLHAIQHACTPSVGSSFMLLPMPAE